MRIMRLLEDVLACLLFLHYVVEDKESVVVEGPRRVSSRDDGAPRTSSRRDDPYRSWGSVVQIESET